MGAIIFVGVVVLLLVAFAAYRQHKLGQLGDRTPGDEHTRVDQDVRYLGGGGGAGAAPGN